MVFKDLNSLEQYIKNAVNDTLNNDVASEVGADFMENAIADVYEAYNPHYYERSYSLVNSNTYVVSNDGDMEISITVNHPHGELIEYGHGVGGYYEYPFNSDDTAWKFLRPRPFYRHTVEALKDGRFKDLVRDGLNSHGLNVK